MSRDPQAGRLPVGRARPRGEGLTRAAFVLLVCCVAGRCFVQELPFRFSALQHALAPVGGRDASRAPVASRQELARTTYAMLLLASAALAVAGAARAGGLRPRRPVLAALVALFAAAALVSALRAADRRSGLLVWMEQVSLLAACLTAAHLCRDLRRRGVLLAVLLALGIAMAANGLWYHFVEAPQTWKDYQALAGAESRPTASRSARATRQGDPRLAERSAVATASPLPGAQDPRHAELVEARLKERTPLGYLGLANPFASLLIVLLAAAGGVAAGAAGEARRAWRARPKGEVPASAVAAGAAALAAAAILLTLLFTRSRAGIVSAGVALAGAGTVAVFRRAMARHWRKAVAAAFLALALPSAAVVAWGLRRDALPGKSLTFRWFYWTASAQVFRAHPVWGVGGGNFADAYLERRRAEAEENVKDPHNLLAHALTQFGLAGGLPYLAVVAAVLVGLARPARSRPMSPEDPRAGGPFREIAPGSAGLAETPGPGTALRRWVPVLAAGGAAVFLSRAIFGDLDLEAISLFVEAVWPALVFAAFLLLALWVVRAGGPRAVDGPWARLAMGAGAAAFLLHNLAEFSLWTPGVALAFWTAAGLGLSLAGEGEPSSRRADATGPADARGRAISRPRGRLLRVAAPAAAAGSVAAVLAAGVWLWRPILRKAIRTQEAAERVHRHDPAGAAAAAARAARADPLDDIAAADAARLAVAAWPASGAVSGAGVEQARAWAREAIRRNPRSASHERLAGNIAWRMGPGPARDEALAHMRRAVALDPAEARLRIEFARMLCEAGEFAECLRELAAAEGLDRRLTEFSLRYQSAEDRAKGEPPSKMVLSAAERVELESLRARAQDGTRAETQPSSPAGR